MVRYLQASDIHGVDRVRTVIETANAVGGLDAVMLCGDLVDARSEEYEYMNLITAPTRSVMGHKQALGQLRLAGLSNDHVRTVMLSREIEDNGGVRALESLLGTLRDSSKRSEVNALLTEYHDREPQFQEIDSLIVQRQQSPEFQSHVRDFQELADALPNQIIRALGERQYHDRQTLDSIFETCAAPVYVGDGNHDGQALRELNHAVNMGTLSAPLDIGGVTFAYEANTRENIVLGPLHKSGVVQPQDMIQISSMFYGGLDSMSPEEFTTRGFIDAAKKEDILGDSAAVENFRQEFLAGSRIHQRLESIGPVDIFLAHNPSGRFAFRKDQSGEHFIDYSLAVDEYLRNNQPPILGWGHIHGGEGYYPGVDSTFGYDYTGFHTTDNFFYVIDVDADTKKVNWYEKFEILNE